MKIEEKGCNTLPKMTSEARRIRVLGRPGNLKSVRVPVQLFARKHLYTFRSKKKRISKKSPQHQCVTGFPSLDGFRLIVGTTGFEPATPCTPCKCATGLRYVPNSLSGYSPLFRGRENTPKSPISLTNTPLTFFARPVLNFWLKNCIIIVPLYIPSIERYLLQLSLIITNCLQELDPVDHPLPCGRPRFKLKQPKSTE
jgi:hypothetical protein